MCQTPAEDVIPKLEKHHTSSFGDVTDEDSALDMSVLHNFRVRTLCHHLANSNTSGLVKCGPSEPGRAGMEKPGAILAPHNGRQPRAVLGPCLT